MMFLNVPIAPAVAIRLSEDFTTDLTGCIVTEVNMYQHIVLHWIVRAVKQTQDKSRMFVLPAIPLQMAFDRVSHT